MNEQQYERTIEALVTFVERTSKSATTQAELEAMVQVAQMLPYLKMG